MTNREKLEDLKRYREITEGIKEKVSNQAQAMSTGAYLGSLEKLKEVVENGCDKFLWRSGLVDIRCGMEAEYAIDFSEEVFCDECRDIIKEIDALVSGGDDGM